MTFRPGTINIGQYAYNQLATFEDRLKALLSVALVAGFDETSMRVMAKRLWLHSCSTHRHAYYEVHAKRGQEAMDHMFLLIQISPPVLIEKSPPSRKKREKNFKKYHRSNVKDEQSQWSLPRKRQPLTGKSSA